MQFHDLTEGVFDLDGIRVTTWYLNHPGLCLGYRLEAGPGAMPIHHEDERHVRFLEEADLVIHDAQYSLDDFPRKAGWGHKPVERAVDYAIVARAKRLALCHHDPERDDEGVDRLAERARQRAKRGDHDPEVFAAAEGQILELPRRASRSRAPIEAQASALISRRPRTAATVLVVEDDPDMARLIQAALEPEEIRLFGASDGETALRIAREERPTLILLDLNIPALDGMQVCRTLRTDPDPRHRDVPILILTGTRLAEEDLVNAFLGGATDFLTKPIKPTLVCSRVRGWLLRTGPH